MKLLSASKMSGGYGATDILSHCTVEVDRGEISVIVGPNGAGKSTAMKAIFGMINLREGFVRLDGQDITHLPPQDRVGRGMAFVPQNSNVFPSLTVEENLEMGGYLHRSKVDKNLERVYSLFNVLGQKRKQAAGELSGGQRQQLAFGRGLMTEPKVLMLDEPTAGVSPIVMDELFGCIVDIRKTGIGVVIVEQNAKQALSIADMGYVLVNGENRHTDAGRTLLENKEVRRSFLGG
ncbi:MAG: ABC transporter ATP-binding protein [Acidiferrobacteraceae bacterium]|nr:ABC transporter ATP-binding protein [Acidiferrobacteraceae bacterium]